MGGGAAGVVLYPSRLSMMMTMCCMAASLDWRPYEHQTRPGARDLLGVVRLDDA